MNYVTQLCIIWTHPTHITYYGDALVNETKKIPPSAIVKNLLSQNTLSTIHSSTLLEWYNPWPHVANRHISISQLLSL